MLAGQFNRFITFHIASRRYRPSFKHLVEHVGARPSHKVNPGLRPPFIERIVEITSVDAYSHRPDWSELELGANPSAQAFPSRSLNPHRSPAANWLLPSDKTALRQIDPNS